MRRLLLTLTFVLILAACGSDADDVGTEGDTSTTAPPTSVETTTTTTIPGEEPDGEQAKLDAARATWDANRPASYEVEYTLICECDQGPWRVRQSADGTLDFEHVGGFAYDQAPYESIDAIFDDIQSVLDEGRFPVRVTYDDELGYPTEYVFNEPELPVDGGFILEVASFVADPPEKPEDPDASAQRAELEAARQKWDDAGIDSYAYTFMRSCFCPEEYRGPYKVFVEDGEITSATFNAVDILDIEILNLGSYGELISTVDDVFAELDRSIGEAASVMATYDDELGFPTDVFIDVELTMADEEIGYTITELRAS